MQTMPERDEHHAVQVSSSEGQLLYTCSILYPMAGEGVISFHMQYIDVQHNLACKVLL